MPRAARPGGLALGALSGQYPEPGMGLVGGSGPFLTDDFFRASTVSLRYGDALWELVLIGAGATSATSAPAADTEIGVQGVTTAALPNTGGVLAYSSASLFRSPPAGSVWAVKLRTTSTASYELWSGFAENTGARVDSGTSNDFVGVRSVGGNLFGVVKNGTSESTVDLGIDCESAYQTVGFERLQAGTFQFFTLDTSDVQYFERTDVGDPVANTNAPNTTLVPVALGLVTNDATARDGFVDWWSWGGRCAR